MMTKPLTGLKVVELAMWAFGPSAGAALADLGATVIKLEPPAGDPMRHLTAYGITPGTKGFSLFYELLNRGKKSVTLDLSVDGAIDVLHRLLGDADVFLTSLLPDARRKLNCDVDDLMPLFPNLIYAIASGQGPLGPDAEKGGYDAISFWARSGAASAITPADAPYPLSMPAGGFGDVTSGALLAGGVAAAIAQRALTGKVSVVDVTLLGTGMWAMQFNIAASTWTGLPEMPKLGRMVMPNPLVGNYRTREGRYIALNMLQPQRYWPGLCRVLERPDLIDDSRFATDQERVKHVAECVAILDEVFATKSLSEWQSILPQQEGQWDTVRMTGELASDPAALANRFIQDVDYGDGRVLKMVSSPFMFDRAALEAGPAPELGGQNDEVLTEHGYDEDEIIGLKVAGIVY
jgi:crotonobetainyl-CoA:carnitine CoA-transferase CaiB-like acyl-CoA transferase